jgi:cyclohexanone monooxygenase
MSGAAERYDAVIVGAGFAGLYALKRLRDDLGLRTIVLEAGAGIGGTWFWNRYPGARCDVESLDYQYSFSPELVREWRWSQRYAPQEEILRYLEYVAERYNLLPDIAVKTRVTAASFDENDGTWTVSTDTGRTLIARFCVMATGCLSVPKAPEVLGIATFSGAVLHTSRWPHEGVDLIGRRVAVIGTGSSGIQVIPMLAGQASELTVFQRTPNFIAPANNDALAPDEVRTVVAGFEQRRRRIRESATSLSYPEGETAALEIDNLERERELEARYAAGGLNMIGVFTDVMVDRDANEHLAAFFRRKLRERVVDPAVADALTPRGYPWGTKRLCVDTDFYETFNQDGVHLVDLRTEPLEEIVPAGIRTAARTYEVDAIVFATGFDAITGALLAIDIRGRSGRPLAEHWRDGPRTYLGLAISGFPNLFLITGPGSPSVFSNMVISIEQHVDWIADLLATHRNTRIEATPEAENAWVDHVNEVANTTLVAQANSWYMGANIPGKPRVFMPYLGGVGAYAELCTGVANSGYEGFTLTSAARAPSAPV